MGADYQRTTRMDMAVHATRALQLTGRGIPLLLGVMAFCLVASQQSVMASILVLLSGIELVLLARSLDASAVLLDLLDAPLPRWVPWAKAFCYGLGVASTMYGGWQVYQGWPGT